MLAQGIFVRKVEGNANDTACLRFRLHPFTRSMSWTIVIIVIFLLSGSKPIRSILKFVTLGTISFLLLYRFSIGYTIIDILPYVGSKVNTGTADYRVKLLNNAWIVINRNPLFGSVDYLKIPEMREMIQGQQIIDVMNTYVGIALQTGLVGLSVFLIFFLATLMGLPRAVPSLPEAEFELKLMERALFATLCATLVTIFTVRSVSLIPIFTASLQGSVLGKQELFEHNYQLRGLQ